MNTNKNIANKLLTYTFALFLFIIGFDKILQTDLISNWQTLVGPLTRFLLPLSAGSIVTVEGILEILLGMLLLTRWKKISLVFLVVTIGIVIVDLFILHYYNLAIREIILVMVCFAIYLLDEHTPELIQ
ncbi:MAG TPA: hypothetical protein VMR46_01095 [Candidatus Paceibacterota bacterium]|nr:hypothetical protein [Candidatus Paceibacterota bacterium]